VSEPERQAVLAPITESAIFLVLTVAEGSEAAARDLLTDVETLVRSVGFRIPEGGLTCAVGAGAAVWDRLLGSPRPKALHRFEPVVGPRHTAVSTPGDLLFHIRAHRFDLCFELAHLVISRLTGHAQVVDEVHGFRSFDQRDLLGFVDGTENPQGPSATAAVEVGDEDPAFRGGSYVVVQKYLHDLSGWDSLSIETQERMVGRSKLSDVELPEGVKPSNSHVALNTIVDAGGEQKQILRFNMPFGRVGAGEYGTYFIGYSRDPSVIEEMLRNMFIGRPQGQYDHLLDFSTAVTGGLFFVPTAAYLRSLKGALKATGEAASGVPEATVDEGSLAIGSLKGSAT